MLPGAEEAAALGDEDDGEPEHAEAGEARDERDTLPSYCCPM